MGIVENYRKREQDNRSRLEQECVEGFSWLKRIEYKPQLLRNDIKFNLQLPPKLKIF